jgi:hypothetical protein
VVPETDCITPVTETLVSGKNIVPLSTDTKSLLKSTVPISWLDRRRFRHCSFTIIFTWNFKESRICLFLYHPPLHCSFHFFFSNLGLVTRTHTLIVVVVPPFFKIKKNQVTFTVRDLISPTWILLRIIPLYER